MGPDIRLPIGLLFTLLGVLLVIYGIVSPPEIYRRTLGININLYWGAIVLLFGLTMLALARSGRRRSAADGRVDGPDRGRS